MKGSLNDVLVLSGIVKTELHVRSTHDRRVFVDRYTAAYYKHDSADEYRKSFECACNADINIPRSGTHKQLLALGKQW